MKYHFGDVLKMLIAGRGMSLDEFSERTGIPRDWINMYVRDDISPTTDDIISMAKVLQVDPNFLISGVDNSVRPNKKCSSFQASYAIALHNSAHWNSEQKRKMAKLMLK